MQPKKFVLFFYLIPILSFLPFAQASDYYVDAQNGNNNWDGLAPTYEGGTRGPWKSNGKVNWHNGFSLGDRVLYRRGQVFDRILTRPNHVGSAEKPFTFGAYGEGEPPIITAVSRVCKPDGWTSLGDGRYTHPAEPPVEHFLEDRHTIKQASTFDLLDGRWKYDATNKLLYYRPLKDKPARHEVRYGNAASIGLWNNSSHFRFENLWLIGSGVWHYHTEPNMNNVVFKNCKFTDNANLLLWTKLDGGASSSNVVIENCEFRNNVNNIYLCAQGDRYGTWDGAIIRNNKIYDTNIRFDGSKYIESGEADSDGISLQNARNILVEGNEIARGTNTGGIVLWNQKGFPSTGVVIRGNYLHDLETGGILLIGGADLTTSFDIYNNIVANVATKHRTWRGYWGGIFLARKQHPSLKSRIYNNTIINSDAGINLFGETENYIIMNNIIVNPRSNIVIAMKNIKGNRIDYNCYYNNLGKYIFLVSSSQLTWEGWKAFGQDAHSLVADPKFINLERANFRLHHSSPCIGKGIDVGLLTDFFGNPWRTPPSIGAIEYYGEARSSAPNKQR